MTAHNNNYSLPMINPEDDEDMMFKVVVERPEPAGVKLSRKNICNVTITPEVIKDASDEHAKLIEFYLTSK
jgi:hypothetical protein